MSCPFIQPDSYQQQLEEKANQLAQQFSPFTPPELEIFASPKQNYRSRCEFRVWHQGDDLYYIMFDQATKAKIRVDQFGPGSALINQLMPELIEQIKTIPVLRHKLFQIDFLSTLSGEILVSLLYHKPLDAQWQQQAQQLKAELSGRYKIDLIGRARKQKICIDREFVIEKLTVFEREFTYKQVENSFTQPNAKVAEKMLEWAVDCTRNNQGDLLELYCGNGNFSLALAQNFNRVLATEIAKPSVESAQYNIAANEIDNVTIIRMSAEEFTQAMKGERAFSRLKGIDLNNYQCNTIFVDPPRAGLDPATVKMVQEYDNILYISCNPDTLADNLSVLSQTHHITRFALFDQFPYTHHMESGVYLQRK
ncbi:tRNA (uridine(54)-C5)-methyltransferase TrmA [Motilimonas eburnea]|uniref:tRNA (uridine(54)-C5)-methyltransferase TrmA n=1 Tax=Motilimonas eburnea TaxID=1737488 RepID=UPI001E39FC78|nr:tRNA (uridine(54)-C5)-methyltransferase TrmA [Motilimonas eburnea]MCE2573866.1 tRNA (uridine(54)-C5)-methyltransferase TrmA [Motilimonas eburnea]